MRRIPINGVKRWSTYYKDWKDDDMFRQGWIDIDEILLCAKHNNKDWYNVLTKNFMKLSIKTDVNLVELWAT